MKLQIAGRFIMILLLGACGCSSPWINNNGKNGKIAYEKYLLTNITIKPCINSESGALENALSYSGYNLSEMDILGGGGIGLSMQKSEIPIMSFESPEAISVFLRGARIPFRREIPEDDRFSWTEIKNILSAGSPVILKVDVRWLTYRYGGKPGPYYIADGNHYVTLFGIDTENDTAWVSDSPYRELQALFIEDLDNARGSKLKVDPPQLEYYWIPAKEPGYRYDWKTAVSTAIGQTVSNMESPVPGRLRNIIAYQGIKAADNLSNEIYLFERRIRFYGLLQTVFYTLYNDISLDQNDGAAFRIFMAGYLKEAYLNTHDSDLPAIIAALDESAEAWKDLALEFRKISGSLKDFKNISERRQMYSRASFLAGKVSASENKLYRLMKKYSTGMG